MKKQKFLYSVFSNDKSTTGELVYKRNFLFGIILCLAGAAVAFYAFHLGLLKLLGIAIFLAANALFLAGVYQLLGVAEITCPECGRKTGVSRLQKECKCKNCAKKFKIVTNKN